MRVRAALAVFGLSGAALVLPFAATAAAVDPVYTAFTADSQPGDPVGAGQVAAFAAPGATVAGSGTAASVTVTATDGANSWQAVLTPPTGGALAAANYPTERTATASKAGLDVSRDGTSCATSTGAVTVYDVTFDGGGNLATLTAKYRQTCAGATGALYGELRYNSATPYAALGVTLAAHDFGPVVLGRTSASTQVTMTNPGTTSQTVTLTLIGAQPADFGVVTENCTTGPIAPGASCTASLLPVRPAARRAQ